MPYPTKLDRRAVLKGLAGVTLALPVLEAMGKDVVEQTPRRFCALYTANGMSLPNKNPTRRTPSMSGTGFPPRKAKTSSSANRPSR
jgi:hypothetical protein